MSFDEVAELYTSRLIMVFAINIIGLFIALYLFELGYSVIFIALLYAGLYSFKLFITPLAAKYIATYGPKHGVLLANIIRVPAMAAMFMIQDYGVWAVVAFGVLQQVSSCIYNISYWVDFSKVRHPEHAGKELGIMQLIEKFAKVLSPVVGGFVAMLWGPGVVIFISAFLFVASSVPLLRTVEPIKLGNKLTFRGFPWRLTRKSFVAELGSGFDFVVSGMAWTLFSAIVVFSTYGQGIYAVLGVLASAGVLVSMAAAWVFGKIADKRQGDVLFGAGVIANAAIHAFRPFAATPASVVGINIANETATSAYVLPWTRAIFDVADTSGFRIVYFSVLQAVDDLGSALACVVLAGLVWWLGVVPGLQLFFVVGAFFELILLVGRRYTR